MDRRGQGSVRRPSHRVVTGGAWGCGRATLAKWGACKRRFSQRAELVRAGVALAREVCGDPRPRLDSRHERAELREGREAAVGGREDDVVVGLLAPGAEEEEGRGDDRDDQLGQE